MIYASRQQATPKYDTLTDRCGSVTSGEQAADAAQDSASDYKRTCGAVVVDHFRVTTKGASSACLHFFHDKSFEALGAAPHGVQAGQAIPHIYVGVHASGGAVNFSGGYWIAAMMLFWLSLLFLMMSTSFLLKQLILLVWRLLPLVK